MVIDRSMATVGESTKLMGGHVGYHLRKRNQGGNNGTMDENKENEANGVKNLKTNQGRASRPNRGCKRQRDLREGEKGKEFNADTRYNKESRSLKDG